jgi:hypothetical protein
MLFEQILYLKIARRAKQAIDFKRLTLSRIAQKQIMVKKIGKAK